MTKVSDNPEDRLIDDFIREDEIKSEKVMEWHRIKSEQAAKLNTSKVNLPIQFVSNVLPTKSKFIDLLIENTEHAGRDEGIYFSDTLRYNSTEKDIQDFQKMIEDYKKQ